MTITNTSDVWMAPANTVRMPLFSNTKAAKTATVIQTTTCWATRTG